MTAEKAKRKLAAILSADVKGYSRLMAEDEEATVRTITAYREVMTSLIGEHQGRVADAKGDNVLAEFASVVDAIRCAVEIQKELKERNSQMPEHRRMAFRIGINLGDVIEEGETIYGDGVNVAARLEGLAEGGGICISGTAFDHVKNRIPVGYEYQGKQGVKNIPDPVRVYRVLMEPEHAGKVIGEKGPKGTQWRWVAAAVAASVLVAGGVVCNFYWRAPKIEPASKEKMALPLPDKPSIAVLPFLNMSSNPEYDSLADSLSENIIYTLSYLPGMFVISRNSTFSYKGKPVEIRHVAEQLGVRYVLEGSVLRAEDRVRVTAQLIDATTGYHLWSGRFDRTLKDIFSLLDEITKNIAIQLQVKVSPDQWAVLTHKTENFDAWADATKAYSLLVRGAVAEAQVLAEKAVVLDPKYGFGWGVLAALHTLKVYYGLSKSPADSIKLAAECNEKALTLDPMLSCSTANRGQIYLLQGKIEDAIALGKKAIDMAPSLDANYIIFGMTLDFAGRFEEAIPLFKKAMRLNPFYPALRLKFYGMSCLMAGRKEEALTAFKELLQRSQRGESPPPLVSHLGLCAVYAELGREIEAKTHVQEILKIDPNFSLEEAKKVHRWRDPNYSEQWLSSLRKAGLPDKPPLPLPDKPSIAVLPFVNMSSDPEQAYFADGMTEDLITDLSKVAGLFVIARNSTFVYKGKAKDIREVAKTLGVRYVLEGSVRRSGNEVRVNAQLIDATTGGHVWADRFDGDLKNIFAFQDKVTRNVVTALAVELTNDDRERVASRGTANTQAYDMFLRGWQYYLRQTPEDFRAAIVQFKKAAELDPEYGRAYAALAATYWETNTRFWDVALGFNRPHEAQFLAEQFLAKAMRDPTPLAHQVASAMLLHTQQYNEAIAEARRAIASDPNDADGYVALANGLSFTGRASEALEQVERAMRLNPHYPPRYLYQLGLARFGMKRLDEAATSLERALALNRDDYWSQRLLLATYGLLGRRTDAAKLLETIKDNEKRGWIASFDPLTIRAAMYWYPFAESADVERFAEGLRKAGLPE